MEDLNDGFVDWSMPREGTNEKVLGIVIVIMIVAIIISFGLCGKKTSYGHTLSQD